MNPEKDLPYNLRNNPQEDHPEDHPEEDHPESHPEEPLEEPQPSNELLELLGLKSPTKPLGPATLAEQHLINLHQKVKALEENHLQWPERLLELRSIDREGARALEKYFEDLMKDFGKLQRWLEKCVVKQRKLTEKREGWMGVGRWRKRWMKRLKRRWRVGR
ncbi:uncharacterized protein RCC_03981 [Ramularia collo-cygni]|uniref:Uncharacterized protein n=1 Tax=Ramularia collo-cygni TaxID=112498 RepID=A0A2D3UQQ0_9PEZI|nr:uncharacterized protein RCC_03981 [Ramularia collo-cygni]CZT18141.1 uncharacterized protein RCC_03981 [Ramularia collo-cygni]